MAPNSSKWDDAMNAALYQSIYDVLDPKFTKEDQAAIVASMAAQGYSVNWNGIR
ncbi:Uu.00g065980.m01.CDS01 [Anthostomella pinea]|uniref:Uu.00g065980.m01.CDS01 n=1 Tax=Anthostomella pinea TaxID=933095 RepID=A0AAI8VTV6_9PEZI|nr:Uu.00g065980.m01.CDS01 [Anthostomella pinea]